MDDNTRGHILGSASGRGFSEDSRQANVSPQQREQTQHQTRDENLLEANPRRNQQQIFVQHRIAEFYDETPPPPSSNYRGNQRYHPYNDLATRSMPNPTMQRDNEQSNTRIPSRLWNGAQAGERLVFLAIRKRILVGTPLPEPLASCIRALNGEDDNWQAAIQQSKSQAKDKTCNIM